MMPDKNSAKFNSLREQAEALIQSKKVNSDTSIDISLSIDELIHDLEVHQMELEMQHAELQESHQRLKQNRQEYIDLFDFAPIGYIITDNKGNILNVNLTLAKMFGLNRIDIEGRPLAKFISKPYVDTYYLNRQSVFATQQLQTCEVSMHLPNDLGFFARLDSTIIPDKNQCRVAITDITHQKQAEQSTKIALEREQELSKLKSQLLDMITHEFRTPLTIILSSVDTLENFEHILDDAKKAQRYQKIRNYVWHMTRMVNEIASAYRMEIDTLDFKSSPFDCHLMLAELVADIESINTDRITFIVADTQETDFSVEFDDMLLRQIILNIVSNAVKFSEDIVTITLNMLRQDFVIEIADTGAGIPEEDQSRIYDTFFRSKNVETISGTGIGLSIVKKLIDRCRGTIEFESQVNVGTTFTLTFPRQLPVS